MIINFVPNANWPDAATVCPAVACVPEAVLPVFLPQHFAHEQYAVTLNIFVSPVPFACVFALATVLPDLDVIFLCTWTILFTGSFTTVSDNFVFSISSSFWYFTLYVISFIPSSPCWITLFFVSVEPCDASFVIVSYGIISCSTTIF